MAYAKREDRVVYFDSFNLRPLKELMQYLDITQIEPYQHYDQNNCG